MGRVEASLDAAHQLERGRLDRSPRVELGTQRRRGIEQRRASRHRQRVTEPVNRLGFDLDLADPDRSSAEELPLTRVA